MQVFFFFFFPFCALYTPCASELHPYLDWGLTKSNIFNLPIKEKLLIQLFKMLKPK